MNRVRPSSPRTEWWSVTARALLLVIDFFGSCDALGTYDEYPKIIVRLR